MVPFDKIVTEDFMPAIQKGIEEAREEILAISSSIDPATFENTIERLEASGELLDRVSNVLFNLNSAETSDALQQVAQQASAVLTAFQNEINLNKDLFQRVNAVYQLPGILNEEQQMLLEKTYKSFVRSGAALNEKVQIRFKEITVALASLSLKFGENVLAETNRYELIIEREEDLSGLPEDLIARAKSLAVSKEAKAHWVFNLQAPSYIPFMENAENRNLRKRLYTAFMQKALTPGPYDNRKLVHELVKLRAELAELLGYKTYAAYVLEERMAVSPLSVSIFLEDLLIKSKNKAADEVNELNVFMKSCGADHELQRWDWSYYAEKLRKKKFDFDDELIKPYFKLENVVAGVFKTTEKLFGLTFKENDAIPVYHPDVKAFEVWEGDELKALLLADYFPRSGKRPGAWMTSYRDQKKRGTQRVIPHISIVCNFTPSSEGSPSLLKFDEVTTLFHEFGHALHGMLANTTYSSLSGTHVSWDFVELPSQILENWCYEEECLALFAKHYITNEPMPLIYIERLKASATFHEAYATLRQISFASLDLHLHNLSYQEAQSMDSIEQLEKTIFKPFNLFPEVPDTNMSVQFSHIFAGGYAAGYYSYKWAEVLDADAFELFQQNGIFDEETATSFKHHVLSQGGTQLPMKLYKAFRGSEPKVDALLKRAGLLVT